MAKTSNWIITNTSVISLEDSDLVLKDAAIAVEQGLISEIGPSDQVEAQYPKLEKIDGRGKAVLPGFINSHTHTVLLVLRGTVEDMSGDAIFGYMTPISFAMTDDERRALARLGCLEAIRSGSTTVVEPFRFIPGYADGMIDTGLRLYLGENAADALTLKIRDGIYEFDRGFGQAFLDRTIEMIDRFHDTNDGRVQCQVSAHAPDVCSPWMLAELNDLARKHDLTRTVHLSQSPKELEQVKWAHGMTSAEYLDANEWLGDDVVAAHWTFCTPSDVQLLASRGVHMAHCPANSSRRGPHKALARDIIDAGVNIALGTDNMTEDMFQAMRIGSIVHRGAGGGGVDPAPIHALHAATVNGAKALKRSHDLGTLAPGKLADITVLDMTSPSLTPVINPVANIVHYGHPGIVSAVAVEGRFLMKDGIVLCMNESDVIQEAQEATQAAWRRLGEISPDIELPASMQI